MISVDQFIRDYSRELSENNAAIFAGAGLSASAGFVDWKTLLRPLAEDMNIDIDKEHDLVSLAQYHVNESGNNRSDLNNAILRNFSSHVSITESHKILARLLIDTYWTTNYDTLIEDALKASGKRADVKHQTSQLPNTMPYRDVTVYKMHGDVNHPNEAIISKDDYERYANERSAFITGLAGDLISKTFLFLGFSFSDPNLDYVLSRIRIENQQNQRKHFCILRKEPAKLPKESEADYTQRQVKQQLFIGDLKRYNIRTVLVDEYKEIPEILGRLESIHKQKNVFISGAAHTYGEWEESAALDFIQKLSSALIRTDRKIVTGLGLGIGSTVVDGALQEIYWKQKRSLSDQLILRPFPQSEEGKQLWTPYREDMLSYAGAAVFVFGNKLEGQEVVLSNGMQEEFDIAVRKGVKVIPVGSTGHLSRELWTYVTQNMNQFFPRDDGRILEAFNILGTSGLDVDDYVKAVVNILDLMKG